MEVFEGSLFCPPWTEINEKLSTDEKVSTTREVICNLDKQSFCAVAGVKPDWNVLGENWKMRCG